MRKKFISWLVTVVLFSCLWGSPLDALGAQAVSPQQVSQMIDSLFPVTHKTVKPLQAARRAYEALSEAERQQVRNYSKMAEAEARLQALHDAFSTSVLGWPDSLDKSVTSWMGSCTTEEKAITWQAMADEIRRLYVDEGYQAGDTEGLVLVDTWAATWTPAGIFINLNAEDSDNIGKIHDQSWGFQKIGTIVSAPFAGMAFSQIRYMSQDYVANGWPALLSDTFLYDGRYYSLTWNQTKSYDSSIPEALGKVLTTEELTYTQQYPGKGLAGDGNNTFRYACARYNQMHKSDGAVLGIPVGNARLTDGVAYQPFKGPSGDAYIAGDPAVIQTADPLSGNPEGAYAIGGALAKAFQSLGKTDSQRFAVSGAPLGDAYMAEGMLCQEFQRFTLAVDPVTGRVDKTSNDTALRDFSIEGGCMLDDLGEEIHILVPAGTDLTSLCPTFTLHPKSTVSPAAGPQDFSEDVTYTVTSELGVSKAYTVTVITEGPGRPEDRAAAEPVTAAIDRLPAEISLQELAEVEWIKSRYGALSPRQRYLVSNKDKLNDAMEQAAILRNGKIKVACIGDSITEGDVAGGVLKAASYPTQLQAMLGDRYEVRNFGKCGICMSKNSHYPYWGLSEFQASQDYQPDIVIIMLGTNDASTRNWSTVQDNFKSDYTEFVNIYKNLDSKPLIYLTKVSGVHQATQVGIPEVNKIVEQIAEETDSRLADMYTWEYNLSQSDKNKYFSDSLHPNKDGYTLMARQFKQQIFDVLEDTALQNLQVDGRPLSGFAPQKLEYSVEIGANDPLPVITAQAHTSEASLKITQPVEDYPVATLRVIGGNPYFGKVYTVNVRRAGSEKPPIIGGDLDVNGEVEIADVMEACKVLARKAAGTDPTDDEMDRGDVDGDHDFTIADVMEICKILARNG